MAGNRSETDGVLVMRSTQEWGAFFDLHHNAIWRYLCRRAGPTVADDLTSEVFLRALRARPAPRPETERAWLYGTATNLLRERSRKEIRHLRANAKLNVPVADVLDQDAVADRLDAASLARVVAAELSKLDAGDRDTLLLYALTELDYAGIALAIGVPVGTVRSRLHRARRKIRAAIGEIDVDPPEPSTTEARTA
jgi:RNA polymerase sigma factor (sigma-70 family)